ncbi:MAG TPA: hypothetical protein VMR80_07955 [Candidatus Acidoferrum sp.]|nr:hypothetical protein [Candidatus Acidoferrum sp.]
MITPHEDQNPAHPAVKLQMLLTHVRNKLKRSERQEERTRQDVNERQRDVACKSRIERRRRIGTATTESLRPNEDQAAAGDRSDADQN